MRLVFDDRHEDDGPEIELDATRARALADLLWTDAQPRSGSVSAAAALQHGLGRSPQTKIELDSRVSQAVRRALRLLDGADDEGLT